jgi:hypothetical protein
VVFQFSARPDPIANPSYNYNNGPEFGASGRVLIPFGSNFTRAQIAAKIKDAIDFARSHKATAKANDRDSRLNVTATIGTDAEGQPIVTVSGPTVVLDGFKDMEHARLNAQLVVDPGAVIKLRSATIEAMMGGGLIAEGSKTAPVVFTSMYDDRYGAGGTFDTNNDGTIAEAELSKVRPDWAGMYFWPGSTLSLDWARVSYGGGVSASAGGSVYYDVVEVREATARITNSTFQWNDAHGTGTDDRNGRGVADPATIFVRGAQPVIVYNTFLNNTGAVVSIDVNAMKAAVTPDWGRSIPYFDVTSEDNSGGIRHEQLRTPMAPFYQFNDNAGPLVRLNQYNQNLINGMIVRGGTVTTEDVWDDTDIVHVIYSEIIVDNQYSGSGIRLQSSANESLVIKLSARQPDGSTNNYVGFTVRGTPNDITDRIGGTLQVLGQGTHPVVFTSLADDTVGAGFIPGVARLPQTDTNGDGLHTLASDPLSPQPGQWRSIRIEKYSNDRNVATVIETEPPADATAAQSNDTKDTKQVIGYLAPNLSSGDDVYRLGFQVNGHIRDDEPGDVDVYSFKGTPGTQVWIDVDRTQFAMDTVVELLDSRFTVVAWSDDSGGPSTPD